MTQTGHLSPSLGLTHTEAGEELPPLSSSSWDEVSLKRPPQMPASPRHFTWKMVLHIRENETSVRKKREERSGREGERDERAMSDDTV